MGPMDLSHLPTDVAASIDWTGRYTTPVKDQGQCGSCWAFSAVEQIESDIMREHGQTLRLSTQELVDCTGSGGRRNGCQGGQPSAAYRVVEQLGGIESENSYRYTARNGNCQFSRSRVAATVSSYKSVGRGSESSMKSYVSSTGPLSVCVDANSWNSYRGGIMTSCGRNVDHCVQVVGFGSSGSTDYWKVRNSWGRNWGESGHVRVAIGNNLCDINSEPSAVTAQGSGPSPSPTPSPSPSPTPVDTDSASDCSYWVSEGYCSSSSQYYSYMKQHCCHSCHFMDVQV